MNLILTYSNNLNKWLNTHNYVDMPNTQSFHLFPRVVLVCGILAMSTIKPTPTNTADMFLLACDRA